MLILNYYFTRDQSELGCQAIKHIYILSVQAYFI